MTTEDEVILTIPRKPFRRLKELARREGTEPEGDYYRVAGDEAGGRAA